MTKTNKGCIESIVHSPVSFLFLVQKATTLTPLHAWKKKKNSRYLESPPCTYIPSPSASYFSTKRSSTPSTAMAAAFFRSLPRRRRLLPTSLLPVQLARPTPPTCTHTALLNTTSLFRRPYPPFSTFNARPPSISSRSLSSLPPAVRDQNSSSLGSQYYFRIIRDKFKDEQFARRALVVAAVVAWNFETVPYSSRWHLIQLTSGLERKLGEMAFEDTYEEGEALCSAFDGC